MRGEVARRYEDKLRSGEIVPDEAQAALVAELDRLCAELADRARKSKKSSLGWLFSRGAGPVQVRGLYIWGGVGRGKTLLMDVFFHVAPEAAKRRVHFHEFMGEVQERLNHVRERLKAGEIEDADPISAVASEIAATTRLLCFDEFAVNDIADAMILGRLFEQLFGLGVTVVATSNAPPERLYEEGLNRPLFTPFIALLEARMTVFHLAARHDYRLENAAAASFYAAPLGADAERCLALQFHRLSGCERGQPAEITSKGRRIAVPEAANGVARFSFAELCGTALGAGDYLRIGAAFHTIVLSGVPILGPGRRDEARRFIMLVDTLYDQGRRLVVSAAAEPEGLWVGNTGTEAFEFARTESRLTEMRSQAYWQENPPAFPQPAARSA